MVHLRPSIRISRITLTLGARDNERLVHLRPSIELFVYLNYFFVYLSQVHAGARLAAGAGAGRGVWLGPRRDRRSPAGLLLFFFTLVTGPRRSLSLKLSDTRVYEPQIRALLGTAGLLPLRTTTNLGFVHPSTIFFEGSERELLLGDDGGIGAPEHFSVKKNRFSASCDW